MKNRKRINYISIILVIALLMQYVVVLAETTYSYDAVNGISKLPNGIESIETIYESKSESLNYPWSYSDGVFESTNKKTKSTFSILKVEVKGSGVLSFQYKVESLSDKSNYFVFSHDDNFLEKLLAGFATLDNEKIDYSRYRGNIDWTYATVPIEVKDENEKTCFYFVYKTAGTIIDANDCVKLKNLSYSDGNAKLSIKVNDSALGVVTGAGEYKAGTKLKISAKANKGSAFYGWVRDGVLVSRNTSYSLELGSDTEILALFGKTNEIVAQNTRTGDIYSSIGSALSESKIGQTIWLLKDATLNENITIPKGVTLFIPYDDNFESLGSKDGTKYDSAYLAKDNKAFRTLTIAEGYSIEINGTLQLGGVIGFPGQYYQGHTSGSFGKIINNGNIVVKSGGSLDCYGFVYGTGSVSALYGSKVYEPFVVYDYAGGSNTYALVDAGQSPFLQYTMQNIRCNMVINYGALLIGRCNLYASLEYNKTNATIIGNELSGGLFILKEGASLTRAVDLSKTIKNYCEDLGLVTYNVSGGMSFSDLSMEIMGATVGTSNVLFPLNYESKFILGNGTYSVDTGIVLLPGAEIEVLEDAELIVNDRLYVLDVFKQGSLSGKYYPTTEMLSKTCFEVGGSLIIDGRLVIKKGALFGGVFQSNKRGAQVITEDSSYDAENNPIDAFENTFTIGGKAEYGNNTAVITLKAFVFDGEKLVKLSSNSTYEFKSDTKWTMESCIIESYVDGNKEYPQTTVFIKREMSGSLKSDAGDINKDGIITEEDLAVLAAYLAGNISIPSEKLYLADLNEDGVINSKDAVILARYLAGTIESLDNQ